MSEFQPALTPAVDPKLRPLRGVVACLLTGLVLTSVTFVEHAMLYIIVLGLFLCLLGPLLYSWFRGELDFFEPIHVFGLVYFVYFGLGSVWTVNDPGFVAYDLYIVPYVARSALYCLLGYLALIIGYYAPFRGRTKPKAPPEALQGPLFLMLAGGLGVAGFLAVGVQERAMVQGTSLTTVISSLTQLSPIFLFAWALAWMQIFSDTLSRGRKLLLVAVLVPTAVFTALLTFSDKSLITTLIGVPIIARWYNKRKVPWTFLIVLLLVLMFVIFPFYNTYRWSDPNMNKGDRMMATVQTVQTWDADRYFYYSVRGFTRRLAMVNSVAVVVRDSPRWVPHAAGSTIFMPTLTYFIPRVLWPDKPVQSFGREFGRIFRVTKSVTRDTYIAVTVPGELYWNYGLAGVILGMGLLGTGLRLIYRRYGAGLGKDHVCQAIYILLLIQIAHLGASIAGDLVMLLRTLLVLEAMRWAGRHFGLIDKVRPGPTLRES
jgi:hypothetical protein